MKNVAKNIAAKNVAKNSLKKAPRKTVAEACAPKRGRPTNAERDARIAKEEKANIRLRARELAAKEKAKGEKKGVKTAELKAVKVKKLTDDNAPKASNFKIRAFKTAIARGLKMFNKDMTHAMEVMATYKENRKMLKDVLPKHAVNAFEKSLAAKKDEALLMKAMVAAQKHIVEKDFTL
jgi:hypothetical protein